MADSSAAFAWRPRILPTSYPSKNLASKDFVESGGSRGHFARLGGFDARRSQFRFDQTNAHDLFAAGVLLDEFMMRELVLDLVPESTRAGAEGVGADDVVQGDQPRVRAKMGEFL